MVVKSLWNVSWHPGPHPGALKVVKDMGVASVAEARVAQLPVEHPSHAAVAKWAPLLFARLSVGDPGPSDSGSAPVPAVAQAATESA